ncbi:DUF4231 domain-containing protein [Streptomyces bluensis]|uniref:DUF4231 domain-containing protein n=1 Tax=Streptomyces bluensis TaxID=33897 RepID=A0ABW6UPR8_9ACTN
MSQPTVVDAQADEPVNPRQKVAELHRDIKSARWHNMVAVTVMTTGLILVLGLVGATALTYGRYNMAPFNLVGLLVLAAHVCILFALDTFSPDPPFLELRDTADLKGKLERAEEERIIEAARGSSNAYERQYFYWEAMPKEVARLRSESKRYRRWHNCLQWLLILCSAAISAVTALYDVPQPGKGMLIGLGATVSVITSVTGYFKFRERSFNLQQTADTIEQHTTAFDLSISPYDDSDASRNLAKFAVNVEGLRTEQRKREQQLDQPHQGQQQNA